MRTEGARYATGFAAALLSLSNALRMWCLFDLVRNVLITLVKCCRLVTKTIPEVDYTVRPLHNITLGSAPIH